MARGWNINTLTYMIFYAGVVKEQAESCGGMYHQVKVKVLVRGEEVGFIDIRKPVENRKEWSM